MLITEYLAAHSQTPISWLLEALSLSKNAWYKPQKDRAPESAIKEKIEEVLIKTPYYGYKRVTEALKRKGESWNHKRIYKIMGEFHLLRIRKSKKVPRTTNSNHKLTVYQNEVKWLENVLPRAVWVSDITYVWVGNMFAYLALVMDQGSRKVVGWSLDTSMHRSLCMSALEMALTNHQAPRFHHSDRGVQYASADYIALLSKNNIVPSMADVGVSVDNPYAESLNRSIKVEEVYLHAYESLEEARASIQSYLEVYNTQRLHSSLGYVPPVEYEAQLLKSSHYSLNGESQMRG